MDAGSVGAVSGLAAFREDRARYPRRAWIKDPCVWTLAAYRLGQTIHTRWPQVFVLKALSHFLQLVAYTIGGSEIPPETQIGGGLCIQHGQGIVLHTHARIGRNCLIRQGVTIGNRREGGPVPVLGDNVNIGAYAQILGGVTIGDDANIGAMSVVLQDVPAGATAVGNPARIIGVGSWPMGAATEN